MNKCIFVANITKDPELRFSPQGTAVCKFSVAINDGYGDKKTTSYINCVAFGKTAEAIGNYTHKGSKVAIESRVQTGSYDNKEGKKIYTTDFIIEKVEFLDSKKDKQDNNQSTNTGFNTLGDEDDDSDEFDVFQPVDNMDDVPF